MIEKEIIRKIVSIFPSKDLRNSYEEDFSHDMYPSWDIDDIMLLLNALIFDVKLENIIDIMKNLVSKIDNSDKTYKINNIIKTLMHKGKKAYTIIDKYDEFTKFVIVKNIFSAGELIKFLHRKRIEYGIVGNFNYDDDNRKYLEGKKYFDYIDMVYYSHTLANGIDINNPYEIYGCHDHPSKLIVERAYTTELNNGLKEYATFIRNNILYADSKKIFEEYNKSQNKMIKS